MKINIFLLFICLTFTCSLSLKERRSLIINGPDQVLPEEEFNVLMFGDNGEVEYFMKNVFTNKKPNETEKSEWCQKNLLAETYETDKFKCNVTHSTSKESPFNLLDDDKGMKNFNDFTKNNDFQKLLNTTQNIVFLGDMLYAENKYLGNGGFNVTYILPHKEKWTDRLVCGWNVFYRSLEKMGLATIKGDSVELSNKVDLIAGNHSFDIDIIQEETHTSKAVRVTKLMGDKRLNETFIGKKDTEKAMTFTVHPRFITMNFKQFKVRMLDFNSGLLQCAGEKTPAAYNNCTYKNFNPSAPTFENSQAYYKKVYKTVKLNFTAKDKKEITWNVIRAHHPPANPEDKDEDFYFAKVEAKYTKDTTSEKHLSLFEQMGRSNIHIFLGSHVHNAQVLLIHYNTELRKLKAPSKTDPIYWGCFEAPEDFKANADHKPNCSSNTFKRNLNFTDSSESNILYIFIVGNSGRHLDQLRSGTSTNGYLIWSRAVQSGQSFNYGFATANFKKERVLINFHELDAKKNLLTTVASFTVEKAEKAPKSIDITLVKTVVQIPE